VDLCLRTRRRRHQNQRPRFLVRHLPPRAPHLTTLSGGQETDDLARKIPRGCLDYGSFLRTDTRSRCCESGSCWKGSSCCKILSLRLSRCRAFLWLDFGLDFMSATDLSSRPEEKYSVPNILFNRSCNPTPSPNKV